MVFYKFASGSTVSTGDILDRDVMRDYIYKRADEMLVGTQAVEIRPIDDIAVRMDLPTETKIDPENVAEGAVADETKLNFFQVNALLDKWQQHVLITDETKVRQGVGQEQVALTLDRYAKGLAYKKDYEIFSELDTYAGQTETATDTWDAGSGADIPGDVADAYGKLLKNTTISEAEIPDVKLFYPVALFGRLANNSDMGNLTVTLKNWIETEFNLTLFPTRMLTTTALLVLKSPETAIHYVYDGTDVPTTETYREPGKGDGTIVTQYYKTKVVPNSSSDSTNNRIVKITGVDA